jgi:hypothetical protein
MKNKKPKLASGTIEISAKCSDMFAMGIVNKAGGTNWQYDGYVPGFFPDEHFGDYVMLRINVATGKIVNWKRPTQAELTRTLEKDGRR